MGIEQTLDDKTGNLLNCKEILLSMAGKTTKAAKGKDKNGNGEEKKKEAPKSEEAKIDGANNPNRTLFSQTSLINHRVPGYGEEPTANLGKVEEPDR